MTILNYQNKEIRQYALGEKAKKGDDSLDANGLVASEYHPTEEEQNMRAKILKDYNIGYMNYNTPRREFNDVALPVRTERDKMEFNNYITNDGQYALGDVLQSWRSNAQRPIARDKIIALCAYATSRLIYPKILAYDENDDMQEEAAQVMEDINKIIQEKADFDYKSMITTLTALWSPASIVYTGYEENKYMVKTTKNADGTWNWKDMVTSDTSIQCYNVPVEELFIANYYEHDIQKQDFLVWVRNPSYDSLVHKYRKYKNWQYVRPGVQTVFAKNLGIWYYLYDPNLTGELCEEVVYWNKTMDTMQIMVNGVLLTEPDEPNPRIDKKYPFVKTGYELIDEGRFFYYKSLASKIYQDTQIVNTLYQMVIDGTYLTVMPPMVVTGQDAIGSDVIIPGAVTTLSNPQSTVTAVRASQDMGSGFKAMQTVENSLMSSVREPTTSDIVPGMTATEISIREKQSNQILGLFIKMIVKFVKDYGELSMSNILQYAAVPVGDKYQSFNVLGKEHAGGIKNQKIEFSQALLTPMDGAELENMAANIWQEEQDKGVEIIKVNPMRFKELRYSCFCNPDVAYPISEESERTFKLEIYDRAMLNPLTDKQKITKKFLFGAYPQTKENPSDYIVKGGTLPGANPGLNGLQPNTNDLSQTMAGAAPGNPPKIGGGVPA